MSPPAHEPIRADGIDAQRRLLQAGLRLFAEQGFEKTSIREIAREAGVNVASISYYFGDKTGLYRAVFAGPVVDQHLRATQALEDPTLSEHEALRLFFADFLSPMREGEQVKLMMRLHFREMVDPTGMWREVIDQDIRPQFEALERMLIRALGMPHSDDDVQRLAFAMVGMSLQFIAFSDCVEDLAPRVVPGPDSLDALADRLAGFAVSMIEGERRRRGSQMAGAPGPRRAAGRAAAANRAADAASAAAVDPAPARTSHRGAPGAGRKRRTGERP